MAADTHNAHSMSIMTLVTLRQSPTGSYMLGRDERRVAPNADHALGPVAAFEV